MQKKRYAEFRPPQRGQSKEIPSASGTCAWKPTLLVTDRAAFAHPTKLCPPRNPSVGTDGALFDRLWQLGRPSVIPRLRNRPHCHPKTARPPSLSSCDGAAAYPAIARRHGRPPSIIARRRSRTPSIIARRRSRTPSIIARRRSRTPSVILRRQTQNSRMRWTRSSSRTPTVILRRQSRRRIFPPILRPRPLRALTRESSVQTAPSTG